MNRKKANMYIKNIDTRERKQHNKIKQRQKGNEYDHARKALCYSNLTFQIMRNIRWPSL